MTEFYVDVSDVDKELGPDWADSTKKNLAVMQANAWLSERKVNEFPADERPVAIITAGSLLAKMAAQGQLYKSKETGLLSKSVSGGDGVQVSKSFSESYEVKSADIQFIESLISKYIYTPGYRRIKIRKV